MAVDPECVVPRRRDRARSEDWVRAFLDRAVWGTLAVSSGAGAPHVNTNLFVRVGGPERLYLHTSRTGALADAVAAGGRDGVPASFTAAAFGRLLPADTALEFSIEYAAVVASGRLRLVQDAGEAVDALHRLLERYAPHLERGRDYRGVTPEELRRTAVYRLDIEAWSGKQKAAGEHAGAFRPADVVAPFEPKTATVRGGGREVCAGRAQADVDGVLRRVVRWWHRGWLAYVSNARGAAGEPWSRSGAAPGRPVLRVLR